MPTRVPAKTTDVTDFTDTEARRFAITGDKGSSLAKLVRAKLPVPPGFVVTAAAFERGLGELLPIIEQSIDDLPPDDQAPLLARGTALDDASQNLLQLPTRHRIPAPDAAHNPAASPTDTMLQRHAARRTAGSSRREYTDQAALATASAPRPPTRPT